MHKVWMSIVVISKEMARACQAGVSILYYSQGWSNSVKSRLLRSNIKRQ